MHTKKLKRMPAEWLTLLCWCKCARHVTTYTNLHCLAKLFSHKITSEGVCRSPTHSILVFFHDHADSHQKESGNQERIKRDKRQRHHHRNKQSMKTKKLKATPIQSPLHASSDKQFVDKRWHKLSKCGGQKARPIHWHVGRFVMTQPDTGNDETQ